MPSENIPSELKLVLDADRQQAEAVGIVMALFAGGLVSLAQIVEAVDTEKKDTTTATWQTLRIFLYGAIMLNLAGAFLSLLTIKMCTDLPLAYYQQTRREENTNSQLPHKKLTRQDENSSIHLPRHVEDYHRLGILLKAGMSRSYEWLDRFTTSVLLIACVFTFTSLTLWVCINTHDPKTVGITMTIFGVIALVSIGGLAITINGEGWK